MNELIVDLNISAAEYEKFYRQGDIGVLARARDGRRVRFPADSLRRFVTHSGIHGSFRIRYGADGRLQTLERL